MNIEQNEIEEDVSGAYQENDENSLNIKEISEE